MKNSVNTDFLYLAIVRSNLK